MIVNLPKLGQVAFPDGLSAKEYDALIGKLEQKYDFRMPKPEMGLGEIAKRGAMRNLGETGIAFGDTLPAMGASMLGFNDYAKRQMEEAAQRAASPAAAPAVVVAADVPAEDVVAEKVVIEEFVAEQVVTDVVVVEDVAAEEVPTVIEGGREV
jgi:hypothetical protein